MEAREKATQQEANAWASPWRSNLTSSDHLAIKNIHFLRQKSAELALRSEGAAKIGRRVRLADY